MAFLQKILNICKADSHNVVQQMLPIYQWSEEKWMWPEASMYSFLDKASCN